MPKDRRPADLYLNSFLAGVTGALVVYLFITLFSVLIPSRERPVLFDEAYRVVIREHLDAKNIDRAELQRRAIRALIDGLEDKYAYYHDLPAVKEDAEKKAERVKRDKEAEREYVHVTQLSPAPHPSGPPATMPPVGQKPAEPAIAYLKIDTFDFDDIASRVELKLTPFVRTRPKALVIDVRDNKGGWTNVSVNAAGIFLPRDSVVMYLVDSDRHRSPQAGSSVLSGQFADLPVVVLVNGGTASAAEVFACALRDVRKAPLVGEKTFGKGIAQGYFTLSDGSVLKLTTHEWQGPHGYSVQGDGLNPDVVVAIPKEKIKSGEVIPGTPGKDPQLDAAIALLTR